MLGAAFWAADEVRLGSLVAGVLWKSAETTHDVPSSKVRELILERGIFDRLAACANFQGCSSMSRLSCFFFFQDCNASLEDVLRPGLQKSCPHYCQLLELWH